MLILYVTGALMLLMFVVPKITSLWSTGSRRFS